MEQYVCCEAFASKGKNSEDEEFTMLEAIT
jgi:hypothetical protein